jgi:DNA polymerase-1
MRYLHFSADEKPTYPVCFLVPNIRADEIRKAYLDPYSLDPEEVLVIDLHYAEGKKKTPMVEMKQYISEELLPVFTDMGVEYIAVADAEYFKALTKAVKVDANLGYVLPCEFGPQKVVYVPNYRSIFYDPEKVTAKISQGITALSQHRTGQYEAPGTDILKFEAYPRTEDEIDVWLDRLLEMDCPLSIDIETFDLKAHKAGIATISFSWSKHEGIAFPVDFMETGNTEAPFGYQMKNEAVRKLLWKFFQRFLRKAVYHNIAFDASVLVYQLYMADILDTEGLLEGMGILLRDWDCTKLIAYLATNSCAGNKLSLKDQAQEFAGNYAMGEDIKDITRIPLDRLLRYNLIDACSTWHVHEKHWDTVIEDQQLDIYETVFKPATLDIIQMQLTGLPINMERVKEVKAILEADEQAALQGIQQSPLVQRFTYHLNEQWVEEKNATLKKKRVTLADAKEVFNPRSGPQLQELLYKTLQLPVLDYTDTKQPSTGAKTLAKLKHHTSDPEVLDLLESLSDYSAVAILLSTFIPAFEDAVLGPDGHHYLCGNFNLGGTVSCRLSSSDPNLQNIPVGGEGEKTKKGQYGKLIKSCVEAPEGWLFVGLDYASLEDKISALTTKDPNKLKVYTDGYDGHSLRAHAYFGDQMPDIDPNSVESINSIQKKYKELRQDSKTPTFLLTYDGTYKGMMEQCGFSMEKAKAIEARYHDLYVVSDQWKAEKLDQASKDGYVTVAFGLRVRTPLLKQVIRGTSKTPYEAEAEGRTAGNALGQSWCLLNSRAGSEFMGKVRKSEHRLSIRPCAQIHDAQYYLVRDDVGAVAYVNEHLVQAVQWKDHPDIAHDEVKLGGEVGIFWPNWTTEITLPNGATEADIPGIIEKDLAKREIVKG